MKKIISRRNFMRELITDFIKLGFSVRLLAKAAGVNYQTLVNFTSGYRNTYPFEDYERVKEGMKVLCDEVERFRKEKLV